MEFRALSEVHQPAYAALVEVRRRVEPFLNAAFEASSLATLQCKLRYVPIVMPPDMLERYPARSKLIKKDRVYDCAPQLNYEAFVRGTFEDQLEEYLRGIAPSAGHLRAFGASKEQVADFEAILASAASLILAERPV